MKRYLRRLRTDRRSRQAATGLVVLAIAFAALAHTFRLPGMAEIDVQTTRTLQSARSGPLDAVMIAVSALGSGGALVLFAVASAVWLTRQRDRLAVLVMLLSLLALPLNVGVKDLFGRPRPTALLVEIVSPASGLSFPSGHAMGSASVLSMIAAMGWVYAPTRHRARVWVGMVATLDLLICISRIYLGVHWLSDVAAGTAMGLFVAGVLIEVYRAKRNPTVTSGSGSG